VAAKRVIEYFLSTIVTSLNFFCLC
jgi:hypothetical protein